MSISKEYNLSAPFRYFEELSKIPHGSGNMEGISNYCKKFAEDKGHSVIQDDDFNLIVFKEASSNYKNQETIILQGHLDMVCEKKENSDFNFERDNLKLMCDGEKVWADGTTLGGDNGIAIAMMLAILEDNTMEHGPLEMIMTVDEEIGLVGAKNIDLSSLKGRKLINLDSEEDHMILTSCAGGAKLDCEIAVKTSLCTGVQGRIIIEGLKGGHSGIQINQGLGNAHQILGRVLYCVNKKVDIKIISGNGGKTDNVIPNFAETKFIIKETELKGIHLIVEEVNKDIKAELVLSDEKINIRFVVDETDLKEEYFIYNEESRKKLIHLLMNLPNGVQSMSQSIPGLVETSLNFGILSFDHRGIQVGLSIRSSIESAKKFLLEKCIFFIENLGGEAKVTGEYPGWEYNPKSELREVLVESYKECFKEEPEIGAIHAGLECGLLAGKVKGLDCVSIGPNLKNVHSVKEIMEIKSVDKIWLWLQEILKMK